LLLSANDQIPDLGFSPDIHLDHPASLIADHAAAKIVGTGLSPVSLGALSDASDIDAFHNLANGDVLFSLDTSAVLDGTLYGPNDVIRYGGSAWSMALDGTVAGIPDGVNVDAIAMSEGNLLLSLDIGADLGGVIADDADILVWDGWEFSLFLGSSTTGMDAAADVDAIHVDESGRVLVSLEGSGELGGVTYSDEDVLAWHSPGWSLVFDGSEHDTAWSPVNLDAVSIVFVDDNIFADGFE
jgi:hypothetical protein